MPRADLRAARANRVFCTDERRIPAKNTVMNENKDSAGVLSKIADRADGFSSAQHRNSATTAGRDLNRPG
jgi:hypothetical protein